MSCLDTTYKTFNPPVIFDAPRPIRSTVFKRIYSQDYMDTLLQQRLAAGDNCSTANNYVLTHVEPFTGNTIPNMVIPQVLSFGQPTFTKNPDFVPWNPADGSEGVTVQMTFVYASGPNKSAQIVLLNDGSIVVNFWWESTLFFNVPGGPQYLEISAQSVNTVPGYPANNYLSWDQAPAVTFLSSFDDGVWLCCASGGGCCATPPPFPSFDRNGFIIPNPATVPLTPTPSQANVTTPPFKQLIPMSNHTFQFVNNFGRNK